MGQLLALQSTQASPSQIRPRPTKRPASPLVCLRSPSDSYTSAASFSPSPTASTHSPSAKPRPSQAPHLRPSSGEAALAASPCTLCPDFGQDIDFSFCRSGAQPMTDDSTAFQQMRRLRSKACAKLMVRSGLRCSLCFSTKSACTCLQSSLPALIHIATAVRSLQVLYMGQASRFRFGEPVFRFHASDSEASSPSVASSGFAQVLRGRLQILPVGR